MRNILRRVFSILHRNDWWEILQMDGLLQIFEKHKEDLYGIYGEFAPYKSFNDIIRVEYERWCNTDEQQKIELQKILKKNKGLLSIDDWILCIQSLGIPPDRIAQISNLNIPGNLYYEIALRQERITKAPELILYNTVNYPETQNLYYLDHH